MTEVKKPVKRKKEDCNCSPYEGGCGCEIYNWNNCCDKWESYLQSVTFDKIKEEINYLDTWVNVNLQNGKYYLMNLGEEKFDGKLFYKDFVIEFNKLANQIVEMLKGE